MQVVAGRGISSARREKAKEGGGLGTLPPRIGHVVNGIGDAYERTVEEAAAASDRRQHPGAGSNLQSMTLGEECGALRAGLHGQRGEGQLEQLSIQRQQPARFFQESRIELSKQHAEDPRAGRLSFGASLANGFSETSHQRADLRAGRQAIQREALARYRMLFG